MINSLSQASALNPGADLWVMTDLDNSRWTPKIDWYLNLQIVKATRHASPELPEFLQDVIAKTEVPVPKINMPENPPLLIQSERLLPNKWVLVLPFQGDLKAWAEESFKIWKNLGKPSFRIFLPSGQSSSSLSESWLKPFEVTEVSVVLDLSH